MRIGLRGIPLLGIPIVLLVTVLAACSRIGGVPVSDVAEMVAEGGRKTLRDPLRPIRGETRVLVFAVDGVGEEELAGALAAGALPGVSALLGPPEPDGATYRHGFRAEGVVSVFPSSTIPAWAAAFTGRAPGETGVPGNEWFDRETGDFRAPVPGSVSSREHVTRSITDGLVNEWLRVPTLFERVPVRVHVAQLPVYSGADVLFMPKLASFGDLFGAALQSAIEGKENRHLYREMDQSGTRSFFRGMDGRGVPDLGVVYLPGFDLMRHLHVGTVADQRGYLTDVVDPLVARVLREYRERGALEDTYVLFVSDHGHTVTPEQNALRPDGEHSPHDVLEAASFRVRPASLRGAGADFQAVLAFQGASAFVYVADRSTCPSPGDTCDWTLPARAEDVMAAARAFRRASDTGEGLPRGSLDLVLARVGAAPGRAAPPLRVLVGDSLVAVRDYLAGNPRDDLPRLAQRLDALATGPHGHLAGDLVLLSRWGDAVPLAERFYFSADGQASQHGSASVRDSRIALLLAHPGRSGAELRAAVEGALGESPSQTDVAALIEALLTG